MVARKPDSGEISKFLDELKLQPWLGPAQKSWPDCLYRFEPVEAAVNILEDGQFLSRAGALNAKKIEYDSASAEIISVTDDCWKEYVRLYFRPRSPMQFETEGFRTAGSFRYAAMCPMPIVFVLDSREILTRADSVFSNGNLAASADTGSDASFLRKIPFELVYHDTWFDPSDRGTIIFHRHAEVIIPDSLDLAPIRFIGCRSQAEYETFQQLMSPATRKRWAKKIAVGTRGNLHIQKWMFVERATLSKSKIILYFNPDSRSQGPFKLKLEGTHSDSGKRFHWEVDCRLDDPILTFDLNNINISKGYNIRFTIDGRVAYANDYSELSAPF